MRTAGEHQGAPISTRETVKTLGSGAGVRLSAVLAQLVEPPSCNRQVVGSIPTGSSKRKNMEQEQDVLLTECTCEFERRLIIQCREDGMSDEEIAEWLKEL